MNDDDIISTDGQYRIMFFKHADGTHGYAAFKNTNDANSPVWRREHHSSSRSQFEAQGREAWLRKETAWPARDCDPVSVTEFGSGWLRCPFCRCRFSVLEQRIVNAGET